MEPLLPAEAEAADMMSSLPAHLLDEILTRLDLRDAERTSVLSCVWRRRWECLPGLALCFTPPSANVVKIDTIPFIFRNLKSLAIETRFFEMHPILLLFPLLRSSPDLEKLKIEIRNWEPEWVTNCDILSEEWTNAQWTDGMCANLQVVQINNYIRWLPLSFMKLILSKASLLHTLSVDVCPVSQDDPQNELLKCRRASAQAQVLFKCT
ncbi:F-box/FBD/LRR-repeat protein At1g13570-like [Miscanthus floridulus]|uniref:F-box/FBD/LRR-repeat protein At1g13570-like n=1 Tax=Miscanthus floridulus TaxID=154761 RepID=UPI0034589E47